MAWCPLGAWALTSTVSGWGGAWPMVVPPCRGMPRLVMSRHAAGALPSASLPNACCMPQLHVCLCCAAGGVRVLRTNLHESDINAKTRERLADRLFELIPVGVGEAGVVK